MSERSAGKGSPPRVVPEIRRLRPWYHDFSPLGLETRFDDGPRQPVRAVLGVFRALTRAVGVERVEKGERLWSRATLGLGEPSHLRNQRVKEAVLIPALRRCLDRLGSAPLCVDLFSADGYYACTLASLCPEARVLAVDLDPREVERARAAARALELANVEAVCADARGFVEQSDARFDLILCAGGLYHLADPAALIAGLGRLARGLLVLQSVVSLERQEPDYFETPAPGWRHGSRFSHERLVGWLEADGWRIEESQQGELPGNRRPGDRGSSYLVCARPRSEES